MNAQSPTIRIQPVRRRRRTAAHCEPGRLSRRVRATVRVASMALAAVHLSGCAILAGAAAGGAAGYVAGHHAGEQEAREELDDRDDD